MNKKITQEELNKALEDCVVGVYSSDFNSSNGYTQDLFDIPNEDFIKEYEFIDGYGFDDIVRHKQNDEVFKVYYKKDDKIRLLKLSNTQALNQFDNLKGTMTKIILNNGFKPDE